MSELQMLIENFRYEDGELYRTRPRSLTGLNRPCGTVGSKGYKQVKIADYTFQVHRLIWIIAHKRFPLGVIDHIDGNKLNNKIENLRDISSRENTLNRTTPQIKTDGLPTNISLHSNGLFRARVYVFGKRVERYSKTLEGAIAHRDTLIKMN